MEKSKIVNGVIATGLLVGSISACFIYGSTQTQFEVSRIEYNRQADMWWKLVKCNALGKVDVKTVNSTQDMLLRMEFIDLDGQIKHALKDKLLQVRQDAVNEVMQSETNPLVDAVVTGFCQQLEKDAVVINKNYEEQISVWDMFKFK